MDGRIRHNPTEISDAELQEYLAMIDRAQRETLGLARIILCTCSASAAKRIAKCNVKQVGVNL